MRFCPTAEAGSGQHPLDTAPWGTAALPGAGTGGAPHAPPSPQSGHCARPCPDPSQREHDRGFCPAPADRTAALGSGTRPTTPPSADPPAPGAKRCPGTAAFPGPAPRSSRYGRPGPAALPVPPHSGRAPDLPAEALPGARRRHSRRAAAAGGARALLHQLGAAPVPLLSAEYLAREPGCFPGLLSALRVCGQVSRHAGSWGRKVWSASPGRFTHSHHPSVRSQDHWTVWVGSVLKHNLIPTPCQGQGRLPPDRVAQSSVHPGLERWQERGSPSFSGTLPQCTATLAAKDSFLTPKPTVFRSEAIHTFLSLKFRMKNPSPPSLQALSHTGRLLWGLLSSRLKSPYSQPVFAPVPVTLINGWISFVGWVCIASIHLKTCANFIALWVYHYSFLHIYIIANTEKP